MVVVYPIGIPLMYGVLLYRNRKHLFEGNIAPTPLPASVDISNPLVPTEEKGRSVDGGNSQREVSEKVTSSETNLPDSVKRLRFLWLF